MVKFYRSSGSIEDCEYEFKEFDFLKYIYRFKTRDGKDAFLHKSHFDINTYVIVVNDIEINCCQNCGYNRKKRYPEKGVEYFCVNHKEWCNYAGNGKFECEEYYKESKYEKR